MSKKEVISEYESEYEGQKITVKVFKSKEKKGASYGRPSVTICPNCLSHLKLNESGIAYCTGDKLDFWKSEFIKFDILSNDDKLKYLETISDQSEFLNLYDRWSFITKEETNQIFDCGYTNKIFFPIPTCNVVIPDPVKVAYVQKKLGRELTEEELYGESELWEYKGSIHSQYRNGARKVKISMVRFPQDC